jgi:aspartyl-tRNA(Asn)/glutamyl-tRNA(Gln) amidotransferase subunit C
MSGRAPISADDVRHVAGLARLELSEDEVTRFTGQLASILGHAADVAALDVHSLAPTAHPFGLTNVLRSDEVRASLDRDEVLAQAPKVADHRFSVPQIVGEAP